MKPFDTGRSRVAMTALWILFFLVNCGIVFSYGFAHDPHGIRYLEPLEALNCLPRLVVLYSAYIGGIVAFWFVRPFPKLSSQAWDRFRLGLAIFCSLVFNLFVGVSLLEGYTQTDYIGSLEALVDSTVAAGAKFSFVVGPVVAFYFGAQK